VRAVGTARPGDWFGLAASGREATELVVEPSTDSESADWLADVEAAAAAVVAGANPDDSEPESNANVADELFEPESPHAASITASTTSIAGKRHRDRVDSSV